MKCRRVGSVKAVSTCDLYALSNDDFQHVLDEFPNMRIKLEGVANQRLAMIASSRDLLSNESRMTSSILESTSTTIPKSTRQTISTQTTTELSMKAESSTILSRKLSTSDLAAPAISTSTLSTFISTEAVNHNYSSV